MPPTRTTIMLHIDAELLVALRARAKRIGVSLQALIDTILVSAVARGTRAPRARRRPAEG
jgi:hypothetical protein